MRCGTPAWRYVCHTIHSTGKWGFNPYIFEEPPFHEDGMDNPDNRIERYRAAGVPQKVKQKTYDYLDTLTGKELYEHPENCEFMRMDLALIQFRQINIHTGMLNGQMIKQTGRFPVCVSPHTAYRLKNGLYDE